MICDDPGSKQPCRRRRLRDGCRLQQWTAARVVAGGDSPGRRVQARQHLRQQQRARRGSRTEWRFDQPIRTNEGWSGVTSLAVRDGKLSGRTSTTFPVIHVSGRPDWTTRTSCAIGAHGFQPPGGQLAINSIGEEKINIER
jgi:hypothetical protein